jgi:2-methylcitrate synthase/citrate synthase II
MTDTTEINKGLAGVVADHTAISKVDAETNSLLYRGYPVQELAAYKTFEDVAYLLINHELPDAGQLTAFMKQERASRALDSQVTEVIDALGANTHPMDVLRTAVSVIGANDDTAWDQQPAALQDKAITLTAKLPAIIAYAQRRRRGLAPIAPRDDLGYSANFLWMTFGQEPDVVVRKAFDTSMILYAEHSFNASAFTARVIASTLSDYYSAIVGAIGALKGPLHGGANEAVVHTFAQIGSAENVEAWLDQALASRRKIMGFGHRVYKNGDSRVPIMQQALDSLVSYYQRPDLLDLYNALASAVNDRKNIKPNVDYPSGLAYHLIGFDTEQFTPLFVASRVTGWTAHIREQLAANTLIRPLAAYNGPEQRPVMMTTD